MNPTQRKTSSPRPFAQQVVLLLVALAALACWGRSEISAAPADAAKADVAPAVEKPPAAKVDFRRDVQPLLAQRCYRCHGPDQAKGGLRLNKHETALAELESGAHAIVPGKPDESALVDRISSTDEDLRMPPEGKPLTAE